jgi:CO/xanthine dehydrogenase Mo-binding subunit
MNYTLIGKDFTPPDVQAKVTGKAKYAEDFRAEGMLFCKLLLSPMPHARVRNIDTTEALKVPGVVAIMTANDLPAPPAPPANAPPAANVAQQPLTNEPLYVGDPILAVAAENETAASDAIEKIVLDLEALPYTVDPLESLYPGGPNGRTDCNVVVGGFGAPPTAKIIKWTAKDFADAGENQLPMGEAPGTWTYGDIDAGFKKAHLVLDESFVTTSNIHHCLETRSCMAYWENNKCIVHGSTQSQSMVKPALARMIGIESKDLVYIAEYCGGGFGSKIVTHPTQAIAPLMSKKTGRPVMLRISRAEEYAIGTGRPGFQGRIKMGFTKAGRVVAADLFIVLENGPYGNNSEHGAAADAVSVLYQPEAMRYRGISVMTNTTPKGAQRGPGKNQMAEAMEPVISKAARSLGIDQLEIRRINAADKDSKYGGPGFSGNRNNFSSAYQKEALAKGAEMFKWAEKKKLSGTRTGTKVIGVGIGQAFHEAGFSGMDGLVRITPDGILHIHSGVGNLGTFSHSSTSRAAAEVLKYNWEHCVIVRGDSRKSLPWNMAQGGSNTSNTMTRTNYVAAMDAIAKLKEIAAQDLGGTADDYDIGEEKVFAKADPAKALTYAQAAARAIELGGKYSGQEVPADLNGETKEAVAGIVGTGLIGVARDNPGGPGFGGNPPTPPAPGNPPRTGTPAGLCAAFMSVEVDMETGKYQIMDYVAVSDCGTIIHPMGLATQIKGGAVMGIGMAGLERTVFDPQNGLPANVGMYQTKPPSYLDIPNQMDVAGVDLPDADNPLGVKGAGEPPMGAGASALLSALSDAMGGHMFNRAPVTPDLILSVAAGSEQYKQLRINSQ